MRHKFAYLGIILALGAAAGVISLRPAVDSTMADLPERTLYRCANGHEFALTREQILQHYREHYGQLLVCPQCGSTELTVGERDPQSGKFTPIKMRSVD